MSSEAESADCGYCHGIGACHRCWGRAGIERLYAERDQLRQQRDSAVSKLCEIYALTGDLTPESWERLSDVQGYVRCGEPIAFLSAKVKP